MQAQHDVGVGRYYTYVFDEAGNKLRDKKGKLIHKYQEPEDFISRVLKLSYCDDEVFDIFVKYARENKIFHYEDEYRNYEVLSF